MFNEGDSGFRQCIFRILEVCNKYGCFVFHKVLHDGNTARRRVVNVDFIYAFMIMHFILSHLSTCDRLTALIIFLAPLMIILSLILARFHRNTWTDNTQGLLDGEATLIPEYFLYDCIFVNILLIYIYFFYL